MKLLCGCGGTRSAQSSPSHKPAANSGDMSKLKPPSTSSRLKYGYGGSQSKLAKPAAPSNQNDKQPLDFGLALSPTALLAKSNNTGGYIPRQASQLKKNERPVSSMASLSSGGVNGNHQQIPARALDDTNPTGKPKSGLRSFLSRPFYRSKPIPKSQTIATLQSSSSPLSKAVIEAPIAVEEDVAMDSPNSAVKTIKPSTSDTSLSKYQGRAKSIVRPHTGSQKALKVSNTSKTSISTVDSNHKANSKYDKHLASDPQVTNKIPNSRSGLEISVPPNDVDTSRLRSATSSTLSQSSLYSNQSGWSNPDKKKPTMEINPITKSDCKDASITVNGNDGKHGVSGKQRKESGKRTYTIDEELFGDIVLELASLRSTVIELQHHLIGKQEYEEKIREELLMKNEIIQRLQQNMGSCSCSAVPQSP